MDKYCAGCGVLLQDENAYKEGYTTDIENDICQRCFRMKNYGEYQVSTKNNEEFIEILKGINETKDLVLYIVDILNLEKDLHFIRQFIQNKIILVLNKKDVLPKSVKSEKIIEYMKSLETDFEDFVVISTEKNDNIDLLLSKIKKYQTTKKVYVVGHTNVGKSSLINKLLKNYSEDNGNLTISPLPSTTLNKIEIELNDTLTLVDTPGLIDRENIVNYVDAAALKKINPKKEIKPKTYQIKSGQCLVIGEYARIDYVEGEKNSFTVYVSNDIKVKKHNASKYTALKNLRKASIEVGYREDLVINGLGFVKIVSKANIDLYLDINIGFYTRKSLI